MPIHYGPFILPNGKKGHVLKISNELFPCTISQARYMKNEASGAPWHAWPLLPRDIPIDAYGDTLREAKAWWNGHKKALIGKGPTPKAAYQDLISKVRERHRGVEEEDDDDNDFSVYELMDVLLDEVS